MPTRSGAFLWVKSPAYDKSAGAEQEPIVAPGNFRIHESIQELLLRIPDESHGPTAIGISTDESRYAFWQDPAGGAESTDTQLKS